MAIDTQGASVLQKHPIPRSFSWEGTHLEGISPFGSSFETAGAPSNVQRIPVFTGSWPVAVGIVPLLQESNQRIEEKFQRLSSEWKRDTGHFSTVSRIVTHPSYLAIIAMGKPVVPLILKDLETEPNHWFLALRAIEDEGPQIPAQDRGDIMKISKAWLEWGKSNNYIG